MTASKSKANPAQVKSNAFPRKNVQVDAGRTEEENARKYAAAIISPELTAFRVISEVERKTGLGDALDTPALMELLESQAKAIQNGDMAHAEAMLMGQATTLQSLFGRLAQRGMSCDGTTAFEANMRMALRAQSQCRATLEALSHIKNPPVYTTQVNATTGPQQINNGGAAPRQSEENKFEQTQLLEATHDERMDTGATGKAGRGDKALEAVGEINRAKDGGRQGAGSYAGK